MARRKPPEPPPIEVKTFSESEIDRGVAKLRRRIEDVEKIDPLRAANRDSTEDRVVASDIRETIREVFGSNSPEFRDHEHLRIWAGPLGINMARSAIVQGKRDGKKTTVQILEGLIRRLEEKREDFTLDSTDRVKRAFRGLDLHSRIGDVATDLYEDGHYADAVFNASKCLVNYVKERSKKHDLDGAALMRTVFSPHAPILAFNQLANQTDKDEQEGMMHVFEGAVLAIRNPGGHDFPELSPSRALEYIALLSLLANRVQEAKYQKP